MWFGIIAEIIFQEWNIVFLYFLSLDDGFRGGEQGVCVYAKKKERNRPNRDDMMSLCVAFAKQMKFIPFDSMLLWLFTRLATMYQFFLKPFAKHNDHVFNVAIIYEQKANKFICVTVHPMLNGCLFVNVSMYWRYCTRRQNCVYMFWLLYLGLLCLLLIKFQHVPFFFISCAFSFLPLPML